MKKVLLLALLVLASASAGAQDYLYGLPMYRGPVSAMGTCEAAKPRLWVTTDSTAAGNCAAGSGSAQVLCLCSGGAWASVGTGTGGTDVTNLVGATKGGFGQSLLWACEFDGNDCSATVDYGGSVTLDTTNTTVRPWMQAASNKITVDYTTWPGWLLTQQHSTATFNCVEWKWTIPTSDTTYTVVARMTGIPWSQYDPDRPENNESTNGFGLRNNADGNEAVSVWNCESDASGCDWQFDMLNDGSLTWYQTTATYGWGAGYLFVLWRDGNVYRSTLFGPSGSYITLGAWTKTGETTFDRIVYRACSSNNETTPVHGIDYLRIYSDLLLPPRTESTDTGP